MIFFKSSEPAENEKRTDDDDLADLDLNQFSEPLGLLRALIYVKHKHAQVKVEAVCGEMAKETGMSWNKQFKTRYGPIEKFLRKYDDVFELSACSKLVRLRDSVTPDSIRPDPPVANDTFENSNSDNPTKPNSDESK